MLPLLAAMIFASSARGQFEQVINLPVDPVPFFVESNTQLNVFDLGEIPDFFNFGDIFGNRVNIEVNLFEGGFAGNNLLVEGAVTVNVDGGDIGANFDAGSVGSLFFEETPVVNLLSGSISGFYESRFGTTNISGGSIGTFSTFEDATISMTGGSLGDFATASASNI